MSGDGLPVGSIQPFTGDIIPENWEEADGTTVKTPWSSLFGLTKPYYAENHLPIRYRFIIKVASHGPSGLDKIVREVFKEELLLTQTARPQHVPDSALPQNSLSNLRDTPL